MDPTIRAALEAKVTASKAVVDAWPAPLRLSVVFAVYAEQDRIRPPSEHPHGEDFLRVKLAQLDALFASRPDLDWDLTIVDDGCPQDTGRLAQRVLAAHPLGSRARLLYLADAIRRKHPATHGLSTPDESRKGGSILYGMHEAVVGDGADQIVLYTDADLSTDLRQCGLLMGPIGAGADAAIGSRREPDSVVVKTGVRNTRGKLFIYLWKRLLPVLDAVVDTQCGFKAFRGSLVRDLVGGCREKGFAFDVELLLRTALRRPGSIVKVPIAWIDSEAASTTTGLSPYLGMLRSMAGMYRRYLPATPEADEFAAWLDDLDEAAWDRLLERVPPPIAEGDPAAFDRPAGVRASDLREAARAPRPGDSPA